MKNITSLYTIAFLLTAAGANAETKLSVPQVIDSAADKSIADNPITPESAVPLNEHDPFILNSLFFNRSDANILEREHSIYRGALLRTDIDNMDNAQNPLGEQLEVKQAPGIRIKQIYLGSIMYAPGNKSVAWINNRKFSEGEKFSDITLAKVHPDSVTLKWDLSGFTFNYDRQDLKNQTDIKVDEKNKTLTFDLKTNTRLETSVMKIFSGKNYKLETPRPAMMPRPIAAPPKNNINNNAGNMANRASNNRMPNNIPGNRQNNAMPNNAMPNNLPPAVNNIPPPGNMPGQGRINPANAAVPGTQPIPLNRAGQPPNANIANPQQAEVNAMIMQARSAQNPQQKIAIANRLRQMGRIREASEIEASARAVQGNKAPNPGPILLKDLGGKNTIGN